MSELLNQEALVEETQAVEETVEETLKVAAEAEVVTAQEGAEVAEAPKAKSKKKILIICGAALVVVAVLLFAFLHKSKFEKVEKEALQIAGMISTGKNYFSLDTYPDSYENMDSALVAFLAPKTQKNVLEAIKYANAELGFGSDVYQQMMRTNALMGRQSAENDKYRVSWTYHPDDGLEVRYEKK